METERLEMHHLNSGISYLCLLGNLEHSLLLRAVLRVTYTRRASSTTEHCNGVLCYTNVHLLLLFIINLYCAIQINLI